MKIDFERDITIIHSQPYDSFAMKTTDIEKILEGYTLQKAYHYGLPVHIKFLNILYEDIKEFLDLFESYELYDDLGGYTVIMNNTGLKEW